MHLLDTDTLTHLYVGHARVIENLRAQADPDVGTTIVTRIELLRGRFDYVLKAATGGDVLRAQYLLYRTEELLAQINVVPFDEQAARRFDDMRTVAARGRSAELTCSSQVSLWRTTPHWSLATCATSVRCRGCALSTGSIEDRLILE